MLHTYTRSRTVAPAAEARQQHQQQGDAEEDDKEAAGAVYLIDPMILNSYQLGKTGQKVNLPRENSSQD